MTKTDAMRPRYCPHCHPIIIIDRSTFPSRLRVFKYSKYWRMFCGRCGRSWKHSRESRPCLHNY